METVWVSPLFRATCPKLLPAKAGLASARAAREINKAFDPLMAVEPLFWTGSPMVSADVSARSVSFNPITRGACASCARCSRRPGGKIGRRGRCGRQILEPKTHTGEPEQLQSVSAPAREMLDPERCHDARFHPFGERSGQRRGARAFL